MGDIDSRKKVHLVNWESVCISKDKGGLGIRKARDQNAALLTKLGWKILNDKETLILHTKYLKHHTLYTWPLKKTSSHYWKNI